MSARRIAGCRATTLLAALLTLADPLAAQRLPPDTVIAIDALVVTADRTTTRVSRSIAGVSVLAATELSRVPRLTLADALRRVPGFATVSFDGLGYDPQLMVRGFYGGGQAEYVVVLIDGKPLNDVQAGLVAWDAIPLDAVDRIEIVRGGSSALWGDAAIGGVINVITRASGEGSAWSLASGSYGTVRGSASVDARIGGHDAGAFGALDRTDGFRANADRTTGRVGGAYSLASSAAGTLGLSALAHWRGFDEPGPLLDSELASDRRASSVFHRFDHSDDRSYRLGLDGDRSFSSRGRLTGSITGELRSTDAVRTVVLAPGFADTQARELRTGRAAATTQLSIEDTGLPIADLLLLGIDASYGAMDSKYYAVLTGDADAYANATGERGNLDTSGRGHRGSAAAWLQYTILPTDAIRVSAGVRADWLRDTFEPRAAAAGQTFDATHAALSPRLGVNARYSGSARHSGHVYVNAGRSFKAPTLDQLFDQRRLPVPVPPFAITTSNALLDPQHGTSVEAGIYHGMTLLPGALSTMLSVSAYQMDMEDELDFDLQAYRYVNIGRSRHRGVELGLELRGPLASTTFLNYTLQDVTASAGENAGRHLKAIPRHFVSGGSSASLNGRFEAGFIVSRASGIFLDDANTLTLPAWTRVDARLSYPAGRLRLFLDVRNVLDAKYSTTGFPDPSGSGNVYHHPAAGRTIELGLRGGFY